MVTLESRPANIEGTGAVTIRDLHVPPQHMVSNRIIGYEVCLEAGCATRHEYWVTMVPSPQLYANSPL